MPWDIQTDRPIYIQLMEQTSLKSVQVYIHWVQGYPLWRSAQEASVNPNTMQRALRNLKA